MRNLARKMFCLILAIMSGWLNVAVASAAVPTARVDQSSTAASWSYTGSPNTARNGGTAIRLLNGKVLVIGGTGSDPDTAELYDPAAGTWSYTGSLKTNRPGHSATLLQNGKVLVAGGYTNSGSGFLDSAELYDPMTGTWSLTGNLNKPRAHHTATLLKNGKVLIAGGQNADHYVTDGAELYDPATGTWSLTGTLNATHLGNTATLLQNGKVLVAGGTNRADFSEFTTELYDPATETWSFTGELNAARGFHTATLLPNGNVLIAGACNDGIFCGSRNSSAEVYNPATGTWSVTGALNTPRLFHAATLLSDGRVMIAGGRHINFSSGTSLLLNSAEIYDPAAGIWSTTASLNAPREFFSTTLLQNGKVLAAGGLDGANAAIASAELYDSGTSSTINPIDDPQFFVRQLYLDFLGREPDAAGLAFWTNEITACGGDAGCVEAKRVNASAAFFLSIEFQETGFLVYRAYGAAFGTARGGGHVPLTLAEFLPHTQRVGQGVVVNTPGWEQRLEQNKQDFFNEFVGLPAFLSQYPADIPAGQFVDRLNANAGEVLSQADRDSLVSRLGGGQVTRAQTLREVVEDGDFRAHEFNRAFVLMEYFGYLRRNPSDAPDTDFGGYNFWLGKLNQFNGNYIQAEMVKAFISSGEYRQRFGQP